MNITLLSDNLLLSVPSGTPLVFEVVNEICFPPVTLRTVDDIVGRISLGMKVYHILNGYCWYQDRRGRLVRTRSIPAESLFITVDLEKYTFEDIHNLHNTLTNFFTHRPPEIIVP